MTHWYGSLFSRIYSPRVLISFSWLRIKRNKNNMCLKNEEVKLLLQKSQKASFSLMHGINYLSITFPNKNYNASVIIRI